LDKKTKVNIVFVFVLVSVMSITLSYVAVNYPLTTYTNTRQVMVTVENGTYNVIEPDGFWSGSFNNGTIQTHIAGKTLFSSSNLTEVYEWALNYTRGK
jgi:hypothetical protein